MMRGKSHCEVATTLKSDNGFVWRNFPRKQGILKNGLLERFSTRSPFKIKLCLVISESKLHQAHFFFFTLIMVFQKWPF